MSELLPGNRTEAVNGRVRVTTAWKIEHRVIGLRSWRLIAQARADKTLDPFNTDNGFEFNARSFERMARRFRTLLKELQEFAETDPELVVEKLADYEMTLSDIGL